MLAERKIAGKRDDQIIRVQLRVLTPNPVSCWVIFIKTVPFELKKRNIETLRALNIQFAQGFGVSKPIPLSEHLTMLSNKA